MKNTKNNVQHKPEAYLPLQDPMLPQFYAAIIAANGPSSMLSYEEMLDQAVLALAAFRKAQAE